MRSHVRTYDVYYIWVHYLHVDGAHMEASPSSKELRALSRKLLLTVPLHPQVLGRLGPFSLVVICEEIF